MDIDEFEDYLELQDPKVQEAIRKSHEGYLAGKARPAEGLQKELDAIARHARKRGAPKRR